MKKFIILSLTFLGICKGFSQIPSENIMPVFQKSVGDTVIKDKAEVKLFPNPAKNKVELEVKGFEPGSIQIQIIDISGKRLRDDKRLLFSGNENIVMMFSLQSGVYFIVLKQNQQIVKKKLVVQ